VSRVLRRLWRWWVGDLSSPWVRIKGFVTMRWFDRPTWCWTRAVLRNRMAGLLTRTANALKGEPEPLHLHDWSDLP